MKELYFEINKDGITSGSAAYDLSAFAAPIPEPRRREEQLEKPRPQRQARPAEKTRAGVPLFAVVGTVVCVALLALVINTCASLNEINNAIVSQRSELSMLQSEAGDMAERYNTTVDINEVERLATGELGMVHAAAGQTVYVDLSGADEAVSYSGGGLLSRLKGIFD